MSETTGKYLDRLEESYDELQELKAEFQRLVRYVRALTRAYQKHVPFLYTHGFKDLSDKEATEAYQALSPETQRRIEDE